METFLEWVLEQRQQNDTLVLYWVMTCASEDGGKSEVWKYFGVLEFGIDYCIEEQLGSFPIAME